jgi:hypothetical protein
MHMPVSPNTREAALNASTKRKNDDRESSPAGSESEAAEDASSTRPVKRTRLTHDENNPNNLTQDGEGNDTDVGDVPVEDSMSKSQAKKSTGATAKKAKAKTNATAGTANATPSAGLKPSARRERGGPAARGSRGACSRSGARGGRGAGGSGPRGGRAAPAAAPRPVVVPTATILPVAGNSAGNDKKCMSTSPNTVARNSLTNAVFTPAPPRPMSPWPIDCPAATPVYPTTIPCPINWALIPGLTSVDQQVYELRAPWNANAKSWHTVSQLYSKQNPGKSLVDESVRKKFKKANIAVFKATGVYFRGSSIGLKEGWKVPGDIDMKALLKDVVQKAGVAVETVFDDKLVTMFTDKELLLDGPAVTLSLQPRGCFGHEVRHLPKKLADELRIQADEVIPCTGVIFDRWYSSLCFGRRHSLPRRVYKLRPIPVGYTHEDDGTPPVTFHTLLDTYCLSQIIGTHVVSDMILDEISRVLSSEKDLAAKYRDGAVLEDDAANVIRFMDLEPADIETLWKNTDPADPIRRLIADLLTHYPGATPEACRMSASRIRTGRQASKKFVSFGKSLYRDAYIQDFIDKAEANEFCKTYHNHDSGVPCYWLTDQSEKSTRRIDVTVTSRDGPVTLEIHSIAGYKITNKTGEPALNFEALKLEKCSWRWERLRSVKVKITIPKNGPQIREYVPDYFDAQDADCQHRYPSHPGYENPEWTDPSEEDKNTYRHLWVQVRKEGIPDSAQRIRTDQETGIMMFDIEDDEWCPPSEFQSQVERLPDQSYREYHDYRRWLWKEEGHKVPMVTCRCFRPFDNGPPDVGDTDPLKDAVRRR